VIFVVQVLGVFWAWSFLREVLPWEIPGPIKPLLVAGMAFYLTYPDWLMAAGIAGGVAVVQTLVLHFIPEPTATQMPSLRRGSRIPPLPSK